MSENYMHIRVKLILLKRIRRIIKYLTNLETRGSGRFENIWSLVSEDIQNRKGKMHW